MIGTYCRYSLYLEGLAVPILPTFLNGLRGAILLVVLTEFALDVSLVFCMEAKMQVGFYL